MILIARTYGAEEFGKIALSITITGILLYIADFGLNVYSTREVARDNSIIRSLTSTTLKIKFLSSAFTLLITWIIIEVLDYPSDTRLLLYLFSISMIIFSFTSYLVGIFRGNSRFEYEAIVYLVQSLTVLISVLSIIQNEGTIHNIAGAFIVSRVLGLLMSIVLYHRLLRGTTSAVQFRSFKTVARQSFPFATHALFGTLYLQADTIFLSKLGGDLEVGLYQAAMRIVIALLYLQDILANAFFPSLSRLYKLSTDELIKKGRQLNFYLFTLALPLSTGIYILSPGIVSTVYTQEFAGSSLILQFLSWLILLRFIGASYGILLSASDNQKLRMVAVIIAVTFNLTLNALIIPEYGAHGAAGVSLLTNFFVMGIYVYFIKSRLNTFLVDFSFIKIFGLNLLIGLLLYTVKDISITVTIPISIVIYIYLVYTFFLPLAEKSRIRELAVKLASMFK